MLRTSSYVIYVDLPNESDQMLLVHGYTGAYDQVSGRVANYVRSLESKKPPKPLYGDWSPEPFVDDAVLPSEQTINTLKKRGYLTELSVDAEQALFDKLTKVRHTAAGRYPGYVFMPTYDCNLRCSYCFQDHMRRDNACRTMLKTMSPATVDRIFAAMPKIEEYHQIPPTEKPHRSITFFGGEPLLARNRPIIEYIIAKAQETSTPSFGVVSNATELQEYRHLLGPELISFIQITLDGPPHEHNKRRIYADGSGSFEQIAQNISMALELKVRISVRLNIDRNNIHELPELAREIIKRGWHHYDNFHAYTAPINAANDRTDRKTTFSSWELDRAITELHKQDQDMFVIERPDMRLRSQAGQIFTSQSLPSLQPSFCGANTSMYVIDAFANLFACWERTGDERIRIGYITEESDLVIEDAMNKLWRSRNVTTNAICRQCRYAHYCGGGCAVLAENRHGELSANFCDGYAARFRAGVAESYQKHIASQQEAVKTESLCEEV
ncbi:MAG: hypothetical protein GFH27_549287n350 [Chloroflexi bacterium AL-W]|nr:hypothetical protein [Chloroflexi bacterium AL-N1]NOK66624.1 hypothetical protein [Chloroflexi bacterium AL-N10]NOK72012.1 hypothetical protein [Chloroflexi bacterium AL-N5]NOK81269.1 hypothetical protein [Chloroflexi bacterium AL-W]NOK89542.1 hypothetical protein [Chloroflexi bacterium AL-N15]